MPPGRPSWDPDRDLAQGGVNCDVDRRRTVPQRGFICPGRCGPKDRGAESCRTNHTPSSDEGPSTDTDSPSADTQREDEATRRPRHRCRTILTDTDVLAWNGCAYGRRNRAVVAKLPKSWEAIICSWK